MGYQPFPNPPYQWTIIPPTQRTKLCHYSQITPIEAYITATEQASSKLPTQEVDKFQVWMSTGSKTTTATTQHPLQPQPSTMQSPHTAQTRQHKGGSHSGQGSGHGRHGSTRLQQQKHRHFYKTPTPTKFSTRPYPPTQNKLITLLKKYKQSGGLSTQNTNNYTAQVQSHLVLWPTQNSQNRYPPQTHSLQ